MKPINKVISVRALVTVLCIFLLYNPLFAQWQLALDRDSVQVYNKPNSDGYSYYKAKAYIKAPIDKVHAFLSDIESYPQWVNNCSITTVIKRTENEYFYMAMYDMPWPVSDRYSVSHLTISKEGNKKYDFKTNPATIEYPENDDAIQIKRFREHVTLTQLESNVTFIEMNGAYDPAGLIPEWLTDKFMKFGPYDMVLKIREGVE